MRVADGEREIWERVKEKSTMAAEIKGSSAHCPQPAAEIEKRFYSVQAARKYIRTCTNRSALSAERRVRESCQRRFRLMCGRARHQKVLNARFNKCAWFSLQLIYDRSIN
jgi:hypothetical protein